MKNNYEPKSYSPMTKRDSISSQRLDDFQGFLDSKFWSDLNQNPNIIFKQSDKLKVEFKAFIDSEINRYYDKSLGKDSGNKFGVNFLANGDNFIVNENLYFNIIKCTLHILSTNKSEKYNDDMEEWQEEDPLKEFYREDFLLDVFDIFDYKENGNLSINDVFILIALLIAKDLYLMTTFINQFGEVLFNSFCESFKSSSLHSTDQMIQELPMDYVRQFAYICCIPDFELTQYLYIDKNGKEMCNMDQFLTMYRAIINNLTNPNLGEHYTLGDEAFDMICEIINNQVNQEDETSMKIDTEGDGTEPLNVVGGILSPQTPSSWYKKKSRAKSYQYTSPEKSFIDIDKFNQSPFEIAGPNVGSPNGFTTAQHSDEYISDDEQLPANLPEVSPPKIIEAKGTWPYKKRKIGPANMDSADKHNKKNKCCIIS